MSHPRVVQVLYSGLGGHFAVAMPLIEGGGSDDPWEHHLIFYGIEPVAPGYVEVCNRLGIAYSHVRAQPGRPWASWPALMRALRKAKPDAVVLHSIKTVLPARMATRGCPLIAVEHQPNALKSRAEWGASIAAQYVSDHVVTLSQDYHTTLRRKLGLLFRPAHTAMVPTGIDTESAMAHPSATRPDGPVRIGMAARFSPTKAQDVLVAALAHLSARDPDRHWQLSLAGDGTCLAAVEDAVRTANLQDKVEFLGYVPPDQLMTWFHTLDVYAHASDGETLSTSLLQVMAAGVPIVASDVGGISDLLGAQTPDEEPLGRLVSARDPDAFAQAILEDVNNAGEAQARAARAREHVERKHSLASMRAGYARLLGDLG